jgi:hypothetical protein
LEDWSGTGIRSLPCGTRAGRRGWAGKAVAARELVNVSDSFTVRRSLITAAVLAVTLLAIPASASAAFSVGFGEQRWTMFTDPNWQSLGLKQARLVVGWDALSSTWQRREVDQWMSSAEAAGAQPLIAFTRSRTPWRTRRVPTAREYKREFLKFRDRYPFVTDFLTWNEANHCSQPVCHKPKMVAKYFDVLAANCPGCKIVAADLLDVESMVGWLREFRRAAVHRPRIWGIHNYVDANRFRTTGTRAMLRTVKGEIWFTETGGVVKRSRSSPIKFPDGAEHAASVTNFVLTKLARISPRVKRVYLYHFQNQGPKATWDSGVLDPHGRPRPAYKVVQKWAVKAGKARSAFYRP